MSDVQAMVLVAAGTNCDRESLRAFREAGATAERVHVKDLRENPNLLNRYHLLCIPGGFSYGDDLGAGRIFAAELKHLLGEEVQKFVNRGGLVLGICNGFQVLVKAGLLPGWTEGKQEITLTRNDSGKFEDRWTHLRVEKSTSCFVREDRDRYFLPVAHMEGKFVPGGGSGNESSPVLQRLEDENQIVLRYVAPDGGKPNYPWNPNGSTGDIAAISDPSGQILGMMPHPERFYTSFQHPSWTRTPPDDEPDGLRIVKNGIQAIKNQFKLTS